MKLNCLKVAPLLLIFVQPLSANGTSLNELVGNGTIVLTLTASGGHTASCITLTAKNLSDKHVITSLSPGHTLWPDDEGQQSIVVTQELMLAMHPDQVIERQVYGFCFESLDAGPSGGSKYQLGPIIEGTLSSLARFLNQNRDLPVSAQQQAIWVVSDCHPLSSIQVRDTETESLASFVADALGLERPWYTTEHMKTVDQLFTRQVERIYGEMPFEVQQYVTLSISIVDEDGRVMKHLVRSARYGPGSYTQPLDLFVIRWPPGEYVVRFEDGERALLNEEVFVL